MQKNMLKDIPGSKACDEEANKNINIRVNTHS